MKIAQKKYTIEHGWEIIRQDAFEIKDSNLVMVFGSKKLISDANLYHQIRAEYPSAELIINSTSGEIIDTQVLDDSLVLTALSFNNSQIISGFVSIKEHENSFEAGKALANQFNSKDLKGILVISDGQLVNGSELVYGLQSILSEDITTITGGLAGDGVLFQSTLVGLNEQPLEGRILGIGFYGSIIITHGCMGGWDSFGPERLITKSEANVLYELDGKPALEIYKNYLGEQASELPGSALLYPLSIRIKENDSSITRTIIGINEEENSLTFAGNMPQGSSARLMKANIEKLVEGAAIAASHSASQHKPELAILISCVGRRMLLNQRIEEEIDVVREVYGKDTAIAGFYSYGEISPSFNFKKCELHNQTMTITTFREA